MSLSSTKQEIFLWPPSNQTNTACIQQVGVRFEFNGDKDKAQFKIAYASGYVTSILCQSQLPNFQLSRAHLGNDIAVVSALISPTGDELRVEVSLPVSAPDTLPDLSFKDVQKIDTVTFLYERILQEIRSYKLVAPCLSALYVKITASDGEAILPAGMLALNLAGSLHEEVNCLSFWDPVEDTWITAHDAAKLLKTIEEESFDTSQVAILETRRAHRLGLLLDSRLQEKAALVLAESEHESDKKIAVRLVMSLLVNDHDCSKLMHIL